MLENVVAKCPDSYLHGNKRFYYLTYHSVMFLDYYLSIPPDKFSPLLPFSFLQKEDRPAESIGDMVPDKFYSKKELLLYIISSKAKAEELMNGLTHPSSLNQRFTEGNKEGDMDFPILEILLYNMRHTQHHVGQLHLMIRQDLDQHMEWAFRVDEL